VAVGLEIENSDSASPTPISNGAQMPERDFLDIDPTADGGGIYLICPQPDRVFRFWPSGASERQGVIRAEVSVDD
jgi:hypothetical protein